MIDSVDDIAEFYDSDPMREHDRLAQHQLEFDITLRFLEGYLPPEGSVLDIGAGTGRYSIELARRGYSVTAVDLSPGLIDRARAEVGAAGLSSRVDCFVADARDLSVVPGAEFDAVLMMGPLYHLIEESDRRLALRQAYARLRSRGLIFSSLLSRLGVIGDFMKRMPVWIDDHEVVRSLLKHGRRPEGRPHGGFRGYFARVQEIAPLHESVGFTTVHLAGVEPAISADDESYNRLQGRRRQLWLDLLFELASDESTVGASRHLLYVGRRP
ncbi:MAG: class I SAM-dependent methyltransferase [Rhodothermales bacterium]|nr:class I SAM-dependent methyltransferase [Rhodothermales bacterium]